MRSLLASLALLASGCALFRDPLTIPVDIAIRPVVGVEVQSEVVGAAAFNWQWVALAALVAVGVLLLTRRRKVC